VKPGLYVFISFLLIHVTSLIAQNSSKFALYDTSLVDSAFVHRSNLLNNDTLNLEMDFTTGMKIPQNIISMPKAPESILDIDYRSSSYYTPRNVQDKMDQIMNRPRSDSFMPVLAMAAFAASVAAKQLQISKLFELKAEDYFVNENEWLILEKLWEKSPQKISDLYLNSKLKENNTATELQKIIMALAGKGIIKTREESDNTILFFPAQNKKKVTEMFRQALDDETNTDELQHKLNNYYQKLSGEDSTENKNNRDIEIPIQVPNKF